MNRIFKVIYSKTKHTYVVVSELAKSHGRSKNGGVTSGRLLPGVLLAALLLTGAGSVSYAQGITISGQDNTASGEYSATTAGEGNRATGSHSAVTGGSYNTASGRYSTVIGGGDLPNGGWYWWNKNANEAKADWSTILGGYGNTIEKNFRVYSSRFDGGSITINADHSTIVGGHNNRAIGGDSFIAGGNGNTAYGYGSKVYGGSYNFASNYSMIVGGIGNLTGAPNSYSLFGYFNQVANYQALAIGGQYERVIGEYSIGIGGGSTGRQAENATAIGNHSVVTTKDGLALGYQSTTNAEGTISFGHEKGDVSGYDSKLKPDVDGYSPDDFENYAVDLDSGDDHTGRVYTPTTYNKAFYNRLVKIADGQDDHDAVVMEQLKTLAAASDASNIGTNLTKVPVKDADGNIQYEESGAMKLRDATAEDKTTNAESWGTAIGTGKVEKDDKQLVTGGTVADALSKVKTHFYSVNSTDDKAGNYDSDGAKGQNSLAAGVDALASGANSTAVGFKATAKNDAVAVGDTSTAGNNGIAVGMHATAGDGQNMALGYYASVAGGVRNSTALGYGSQVTQRDILTSDGSDGVISVGKAVGQSGEKGLTRRIINVRAGVNDTDAVNVSQLKNAQTHFYSVNSTDAAKGNYNNDGAEGTDSLAAGVNALAKGADSVAVGVNATARNNAIAVGNSAKAGNTGIALGMNAHAGYGQNMALGYYASVADGVRNSTALGYGSQVTQRDILTSDGSDGVISVGRAVGQSGEKGLTRRIINVKAGVKGTDAAAVSQLTELKAGDHVTITDGAELNDKGQTVKTISAVADGKIAKGDTGLLSGGAVYNEVHVDNDGNYIRSGNTVAENLEALDGKVKTNADNIEKNGLAIEKNSAAIDTNSQNIVKNGAAIEKNTADIATNAQNIVKNGAAIEKNTSDISTNAGNIEKNGAAIEKNTAAIATNAQNIVKNSAAIEKNSAAIATNAQNIEKNSAAIATNAQNIEKNGAAIEKNSAAIATNSNNIEKNGAAIEKNTAAIATNSKNIETISTTVEKTAARVETNSKNIEKNGLNIEKNTAAIATNSKNIEKNGRDIETLQQTKANISLSNINDAGKTVINNLAKESIDVKAGSSNVTVATNDVKDGVKTFTVDMAKDISVDSVTAKDVKTESLTVDKEATIGGVTIKDSKVTGLADTSIEKGSTSAVNAGTVYNETRVAKDGHYIKAANTAGANITALDNQVAANAGNIFNLDNRVGELGSRINKVGAGAAALAALHPLDFDPSDKWDFAAGVGNYRNETAAAVGLFYRPNARSMFNLGWTMGDNRNMVNGGFSIKLGKGSVYNDMSKAQMAETIATQSKEISAMKADNAAIKADYNALKADNEAKEKRIDALEKQMQEIMAKLGK